MDMGSAVLAHFLLKEKLQKMGMLGCLLCIVGSTVIVLHAPEEKSLSSVQEIWELAIQPGILSMFRWLSIMKKMPNGIFLIIAFCFLHPAFLSYTASAIAVTLFLVLYCAPRHGQTNILVYTGICSIVGSLTVSDSTQLTLSYVIFLSFWIFLYFLAVDWVVYHSPPFVLSFW